eukprot:GHVS01106639.1.p1 GENE.GHVS01106639.1~~GHVS01106639.1.p1  ORF type:complete len:1252 (-),score=153.91 GHVS01106639.1:682-4437(-)
MLGLYIDSRNSVSRCLLICYLMVIISPPADYIPQTPTVRLSPTSTHTSLTTNSSYYSLLSLLTELPHIRLCRSDTTTATDVIPPPPRLDNLFISQGRLNFSPMVLHYNIPLQHRITTLDVVPVLDMSKYKSVDHHPSIYISGLSSSMTKIAPGVGTSLPVGNYSENTSSTSSFDVVVEVSSSRDNYTQYKLTFTQQNAKPQNNLISLNIIDQDGDTVEASVDLQTVVPRWSQQMFTLFVSPKTQTMTLSGSCSSGATIFVNGSSGSSVVVVRDKTKANQLITVECRQEFKDVTLSHSYFLDTRTSAHTVPPPTQLIVEDSGIGCKMSSDELPQFYCDSDTSTVRFLAEVDQQFRYTIVNEEAGVKVRLLNNQSTSAVPCNSGLYIHGTAGHASSSKRWPLRMDGVYFPAGGDTSMHLFGWIIGCLLLATVATLMFVLGMANTFGLGSPFGASEIPGCLVFILQYFCFVNVLRGEPTLLSDSTSVLKWVTLWWPLPWDTAGEVSVAHISNAQGCLFWCLVLACGCIFVHLCVWLKFAVLDSGRFTYSHKLLPGNWEARTVHFLVFPASAASLMLLCHHDSSLASRVLGMSSLLAIASWTGLSFVFVRRVVKSRSVVWVWAQSLRDDDKEMETGYWSDVVCDQLHSEPANRSLCRSLFPWRWSSTVADIEPLALLAPTTGHTNGSRGSAGSVATTTPQDVDDTILSSGPMLPLQHNNNNTDGRLGNAFGVTQQSIAPDSNHSNTRVCDDVPMSKVPRNVEVVRTRKPNGRWCRVGHQLVCGLFRTKWLDVLFTYESLTKMYAYGAAHGVHTTIPLTVKTHQLAGAITNGYLCFFFDGVRIPFVRCGEFLFRVIVGASLGVAMTVGGTGVVAGICFMLVTGLAALSCVYAFKSWPFCRGVENWLLCSMLTTVALSGVGFMGLSFAGHPNIFLDILLWSMGLVCICLSVYSVFITFCIISAVLCPPLEEYRFLERLCNTEVVLSDHSEAFKADAMGYNRYGTRDIMVQCSSAADGIDVKTFVGTEEPSVELPVSDVLAACRSGHLPVPKVCLCITSRDDQLGYQHINLYDRINIRSRVGAFVSSETVAPPAHMETLINVISRQVETRAYDTAILSITIVMPKHSDTSRSWARARGASSLPSVAADTASTTNTSSTDVSQRTSRCGGDDFAVRSVASKLTGVGDIRVGGIFGGYDMSMKTGGGGSRRSGYSRVEGGGGSQQHQSAGEKRPSVTSGRGQTQSGSQHSQLEMRSRNYS